MIEGTILILTREEFDKQKCPLTSMWTAYWIFVQEEDGSYTKEKDRWDDGVTNLTKLEIAIPV